jgi:hypothetical protein
VLLLNPSETSYASGGVVQVGIITEGQVFGSATLYESCIADDGYVVDSGVVSGDSFDFMIPSVDTPSSISIDVEAQTTTGGIVASAQTEVTEEYGYALSASVQTNSKYADGSFQPGQTVTVAWSVTQLSTKSVPGPIMIGIFPTAGLYDLEWGDVYASPGAVVQQSTATSGTISFTLPSNLPNGYASILVLAVPATGGSNGLYTGEAGETQLIVNVQSNPSVFNYELSPGSGLTVGWLVLLVLFLVLAVVGLVLVLRRRGGRSKRSEPPQAYTLPPTTGAPQGAGSGPTPTDGPADGDAGRPGSPGN